MKICLMILVMCLFTTHLFAGSIDILNDIIERQQMTTEDKQIVSECAASIIIRVETATKIQNLDHSTVNAYVLLCTAELISVKNKRIDDLMVLKDNE